MPVELFPRLHEPMAKELWEEIRGRNPEELENLAGEYSPLAIPGATGGVPVDRERLSSIRKELVALARASGYPNRLDTDGFDVACTRCIFEQAAIPEVEALRNEVWSFLTLVLLPDIAAWRFPRMPIERMIGGVRNTFQRLWLRGRLIAIGSEEHETDWSLIADLTEDAFVAVIERPRLSANPLLAREFAEGWRRCAQAIPGNMESIHRIAARNLMATKVVTCLEALAPPELQALVDNLFLEAARESGASLAATTVRSGQQRWYSPLLRPFRMTGSE